MINSKLMNFDEFSKADPLQAADTAIDNNKVDPVKKEPFVDQVKHADLTQLKVTEPDYSKVESVDEDATSEINNLQSAVTDLERRIIEFKKTSAEQLNTLETDLQAKREALNQAMAAAAATTNTTTVAPVSQQPTAQQSIGSVTPGQAPPPPTTV